MNSWEDLERALAWELEVAAAQSTPRVDSDPYRTEIRIKKYNALKLYINNEDHPPPHMHVYLNKILIARICLKSCKGLDGVDLDSSREQKNIYKWCKRQNKKKMLELWDETQKKTTMTKKEINEFLSP